MSLFWNLSPLLQDMTSIILQDLRFRCFPVGMDQVRHDSVPSRFGREHYGWWLRPDHRRWWAAVFQLENLSNYLKPYLFLGLHERYLVNMNKILIYQARWPMPLLLGPYYSSISLFASCCPFPSSPASKDSIQEESGGGGTVNSILKLIHLGLAFFDMFPDSRFSPAAAPSIQPRKVAVNIYKFLMLDPLTTVGNTLWYISYDTGLGIAPQEDVRSGWCCEWGCDACRRSATDAW